MGSWIPTEGGTPFPVRTGYEDLMAERAGRKWAFVAEKDGVIKVLEDYAMQVTYKDGTTDSCELGIWFGIVKGKQIQHEKVTDRTIGYKFKAGECLAWDRHFFCRSWMSPTKVSFMTGSYALVAFSETLTTDEDGSRFSNRLASILTTPKVTVKKLKATYSDEIRNLVKVGDSVDYDTILCLIVPEQANIEGVVNPDRLAALGYNTPKAETYGTVTKIECLYRGDISNASDSVKKIIREDNRRRKQVVAVTGNGAETGELTVSSTHGTRVFDDSVQIKVYITYNSVFAEGDKYVVSNQLKSVPGQSFDATKFTTDYGEFVDMQFSYKACKARIVWSYNKGVIAIILRQICRNAVLVAKGEKPLKNTGEPQRVIF